jgi:hypothetical protein
MLLASITSGGYRFVLILHIASVVIGIGGVFLLGLFGREAGARKGVEGQAIAETAYKVGDIAEYFIYAIPVFGIALLFMSKTAGTRVFWFDQTWVWLSIILYVFAVGFSQSVHLPNLRVMNRLMAELNAGGPPPAGATGPPPQAVELEARGKRAAMNGGILNLVAVALIALMVWKPGGPRI